MTMGAGLQRRIVGQMRSDWAMPCTKCVSARHCLMLNKLKIIHLSRYGLRSYDRIARRKWEGECFVAMSSAERTIVGIVSRPCLSVCYPGAAAGAVFRQAMSEFPMALAKMFLAGSALGSPFCPRRPGASRRAWRRRRTPDAAADAERRGTGQKSRRLLGRRWRKRLGESSAAGGGCGGRGGDGGGVP
jgi:hypothetical protein